MKPVRDRAYILLAVLIISFRGKHCIKNPNSAPAATSISNAKRQQGHDLVQEASRKGISRGGRRHLTLSGSWSMMLFEIWVTSTRRRPLLIFQCSVTLRKLSKLSKCILVALKELPSSVVVRLSFMCFNEQSLSNLQV